MPFDAMPAPVITGTPSLEALAWALRHPESWPPGFKWDYRYCETCAMGLAFRLWEEVGYPCTAYMPRAFAITEDVAVRLFINLNLEPSRSSRPGRGGGMHLVRPEHVADVIDAYLATRSG